jgi:hypothetical protein
MIKLTFILVMAILNFLRGWGKMPFLRRPQCIALMVLIMGLWGIFITHIWWMIFAIAIPMGITLGISDKNRGVWCSLVALGASFALLMTGHLAWYWFALYCGGNFILGWIGVNKLKLNQVIIDPLTGGGFGSLVYLI